MKKLLSLSLILLGCASMASAQGLCIDREYKHYVTADGGEKARQGVFANGKFYIHNWMDKTVEVWDQNGTKVDNFSSRGTGPAITADQAGNIIIENTTDPWPTVASNTRYYRIFKGGTSSKKDISVYYYALRDGGPMRCDFFGPVEGDVMSKEGGYIVSMQNQRPAINIAHIAEGKVDYDDPNYCYSIKVDTTLAHGNIVTNFGADPEKLFESHSKYVSNGWAYSQVNCFKFGDEYVISKSMVGLKGFTFDPEVVDEDEPLQPIANLAHDYTTVRSAYDPYLDGAPADAPFMSGDRLFKMGGKLYIIKHISFQEPEDVDAQSTNSFAIFDWEAQQNVAIWHAFSAKLETPDTEKAGTACASWFTVIPTSDKTAEIYQYFPADGPGKAFIAKYNLDLNNTTGINDLVVDDQNAPAEYFNLQGVRVANPENGIYIVRRGNKVSKIVR